MIDYDVKTLFGLFAVCNMFIAFIFLIFNYSNNNQKQITYIYLIGKTILGISWFLYSLRGDGYFFLSYIVANTAVLIAAVIDFYCFVYINKKLDLKVLFKYVLITLLISSSLFYFANKADSLKVIHMSVLISTYYTIGGIILLRITKTYNSLRLISFLAFVISIIFAAKIIVAQFFDNNVSLLSQNSIVIISYLAMFIIPFSWTILYLLMINEISQKEIVIKNIAIADDNIKLKNLNQKKDKIFSIIAHDLGGPIGGIIQLGHMLAGKLGELSRDEKHEVIENITQTATATHDVLNNLLQWAKSESGTLNMEKEQLSIFSLVEESKRLLHENINKKNIHIKNLVDEKAHALSDYNMTFTIVRNLIANAVKFTPNEGNITIHSDEEDNSLKISVTDTGVGMTKNVVDKIFNADFQYFTYGTNNEPGTGIGLKLCKEFAQKNGGIIGVESKLGEGSTFYFTLPMVKTG